MADHMRTGLVADALTVAAARDAVAAPKALSSWATVALLSPVEQMSRGYWGLIG